MDALFLALLSKGARRVSSFVFTATDNGLLTTDSTPRLAVSPVPVSSCCLLPAAICLLLFFTVLRADLSPIGVGVGAR